ncbi:hypothetical protein [Mycolicibacterium llatzerense]|uniref:hypothetical protein n=1 Tax=Mycolicibacterium llatzerense TaxID=280871 RepID=UPI0021B52D4E|nr:hypothetical protein [Mycolicibacterium llatzerense]MCT7373260.1 hypothetical protein [Mycolicibacterium llatzerense]
MRNSDLDTTDLEMTTVTATDGKQATMPAKFLPHYSQSMIDVMVMQAHRGSVVDRATCRAIGMTPLPAGAAS